MEWDNYFKKSKKNRNFKTESDFDKRQDELTQKCEKCKNTDTKQCDFDNYIEFSGAILGDCENNNNVIN